MSENVKINIDLGAQLAESVKHSAQLRANLEAAAKIRLNIIGGSGGSTTSNKLPNNNSQQSGQGVTKTSRSIGQGAGTGSAASDFAAQAQGLGGLVHVYATFAANIFAVSAAFSALSKSADLSNMVKGMDQLGAASGRALGTLSKRLVDVTDGAISMRESMNAVAISVAGGMSNSAIIRMGMVAKQASIALGRDMPDAMERLSKGIIKVQPELLDELGIMTRVIPAQQAYALSIGKTASSLTDLEKKQAFANAVLKEGEEKFGAIELSANNYSKILASMSNIAQTALEGVNKFLSPLVSLLASNPVALAGAMGLVASILLKQAIPAIGYFKEASAKAAEQAEALANRRNSMVKESLAQELAANLESTKLKQTAAKAAMQAEISAKRNHLESLTQMEIDKVDSAEKEIRSIRDSSFKKSTASYKILSVNDPSQISAKDLKTLEAQAARFTKSGEPDKAESYTKAVTAIKAWAAAEENYVKKDDEYKKELADHSKTLDKAYAEQEAANAKRLEARHNNMSIIGRLQTEADRANLASATRNISSNAAQTASIEGFASAMKKAHAEIQTAMSGPSTKTRLVDTDQVDALGRVVQRTESIVTPKMGTMRAGWTYLSAGISSATTAISGFMNFLGPWAAFAGIAIAAGTALYSWMTKTEKESAATTAALEDLRASVTAVDNIVTSLSKKDPLEQISTTSINAKAGAFTNLAETITKSFQTTSDELKKMGKIDVLVDITKFVIGKDVFSVAAKEASIGLAKSIKLMGNGPEAVQAKKELSKLLGGVDINSFEEINKFIGQNNATYFDRMPKINALLANLGITMRDTASKALELDDAFKTSSKTFDTITTSLMPTDNMAKLGFEMQTLGQKMAKAFEDPVSALSELSNIAGDVTKLRFFDPKMAEVLIKDANKIKETSGALKVYTDLVSNLTLEEQTLQKQIESHPTGGAELKVKKAEVTKQKAAIQDTVTTLTGTITPYLNMLKIAQNDSFVNGAKLISNSIGIESQKAGITISKAMSEGLGSTIGGIEQKARLDTELINVQIRQIQSQLSLVASNEQLVALQEETLLRQQRKDMEDKGGADPVKYLEINDRIRAAEMRRSNPIRDSKQLSVQLQTKGDDAKLYAAQGSLDSVQQTKAGNSQIAALEAQKRAIASGKEFAIMTELNNIEKDKLTTQINAANLQKAILDDRSTNAMYLSEELAIAKNIKAEEIATQTAKSANMDLQLEYNKALENANKTIYGTKAYEESQVALEQIEEKQRNKSSRDTNDALGRQLTAENNIRAAKLSTLDATMAQAKLQRDIVDTKTSTDTSLEEESLAIATATGVLSAQDIANKTTALSISKEELRTKQALNVMQDSLIKEQIQLGLKLTSSSLTTEERKAIENKMSLNRNLYDAQVSGEKRLSDAKITTLGVQGRMSELTAKQTEEMSAMSDVAGSLAIAFEDMGGAVGKVGEALLKMLHTQELLDKRKEKGPLSEEEEAKFKKDQINADLKGLTLVTGATKELLDTKSDGYKVLSGIEKTAAAASAVIRAQELAQTIASVSASISARIPGIYAAFMNQFGLPGAALATAAIAAFIGGSIKGGSAPTGPSAAEIQSTQGTGQAYNSQGKLEETGGGVLGDISAKSKSIDNSLDIVSRTSVENLTYANKMLDALNSIKTNISAAATALFKTSGLNKKGGGIGIIEGTVTGDNLISSAINSNLITAVSDKLLGGALSRIANDLFGSSETTTILDQGIKFSGTFKDILSGVSDSLQLFTTRSVEWERGFWDSGTDIGTVVRSVDDSVSSAIRGIFSSAADMFSSQGTQLGKSTELVMATLAQIDISRMSSLHGLQGEALTEAFTDSINGILDDAAKAVYPELMRFQKGGEAAFETVSRVLDSSYKIKVAFDSIGKSNTMLSKGLIGYNITEGLSEAAGGLDNLLSQVKQFGDDFLSESERLAPVQKNLVTQLSEMGYASIDTREEFKQLILGFQFTGEASYKTYASLLALEPAFNAVYKASEKVRDVLGAIEYSSTVTDMLVKYLNLIGDSKGAVQLAREKELSTMDERLVGAQKYLYALEDENSARTKLSTIIKDTITNIKSAIKSLKEYKTALTLGDKNTLTPTDQYIATKANLKSISAVASLIATTDAEKVVQSEALAKLPAASDAFLEASRTLYASSDKYTQDFQSVLDIVDSTTGALSAQQSTAELQLTQLQTSARSLGIIEENTYTTVQLLEQYLVLANTAATAKVGVPTGYVAPVGTPSATTSATTSATASATASTAATTTGLRIRTGIPGMPTIYLTPPLEDGGSTVTQGSTSDAEIQMARLMEVYGWTTANASENAWGMYYSKYATQKDIAARTGQTAAEVSSAFSLYGIPAFRNGGLASGISMVGEAGPEIVDFRTPGRVYSNNASNDMFNNKELVAEIKALRQEVVQLRKEQKEQTGHLINSNYDANGQVATAVKNTADANSNNNTWIARSIPKIA